MKIIVSGDAAAYSIKTQKKVTNAKTLAKLDGVEFSDMECGEYLDTKLYNQGVQGGKITLAWNQDEGLRVITEYHAPKRLAPKQVNQLVDETEGQWSDGIGEGDFLHREKFKVDVAIGLGSTRVQQVEDGKKIHPPKGKKIIKALEDGDFKTATELVLEGENLNCQDRWKNTPLHIACLDGESDLALLMINYGADVNAVSDTNDTPLLSLAHCQKSPARLKRTPEVAAKLLSHGADVEAENESGQTPLIMAISRENRPLVEFLLEQGADINRPDGDECNRMTPIMYASKLPMIEYLLEQGADPSICTDYGMNAAEYALENTHIRGYKKIAARLQDHIDENS